LARVRSRLENTLREERPRILGSLLRACGDLDKAEDALADAVLAAVETWESSPPKNGAAWLTTVAKNRLHDRARHQAVEAAHADDVATAEPDVDRACADSIALLFSCCHPDLTPESQVALTLRFVVGLGMRDLSRALGTTEDTVSQRLLRARRTLKRSGTLVDEPTPGARSAHMVTARTVVYAMLNEGHVATEGASWMRPGLLAAGLELARLLTDLFPSDGESFALRALAAFTAARAAARASSDGSPILLAEQDRSMWDRALVYEGLMAISRARVLASGGALTLEAELAREHMIASSLSQTNWARIERLYEALAELDPSPWIALGGVVAHAMTHGGEAAWERLNALVEVVPDQGRYYAVRATLSQWLGRDARPELLRALELTSNEAERAWLARRLETVGG
jgi:RNA polymerase sigma factor (sigma-70 family)